MPSQFDRGFTPYYRIYLDTELSFYTTVETLHESFDAHSIRYILRHERNFILIVFVILRHIIYIFTRRREHFVSHEHLGIGVVYRSAVE